MTLASEQQLRVVTLWGEKNHGEECARCIAWQIDRLHAEGDLDYMAAWPPSALVMTAGTVGGQVSSHNLVEDSFNRPAGRIWSTQRKTNCPFDQEGGYNCEAHQQSLRLPCDNRALYRLHRPAALKLFCSLKPVSEVGMGLGMVSLTSAKRLK